MYSIDKCESQHSTGPAIFQAIKYGKQVNFHQKIARLAHTQKNSSRVSYMVTLINFFLSDILQLTYKDMKQKTNDDSPIDSRPSFY